MLADWSLERLGREQKKPLSSELTSNPSAQTCGTVGENEEVIYKNEPKKSAVQTVGMIIIGDEILNGFTDDLNLKVATKALASIGVPLKKVKNHRCESNISSIC